MLTEYIEEALRRAKYEIIEDEEPYYGEIKELRGYGQREGHLRNAEVI